ncbi:hypothetical protein SAMN05421504_109178 [Amycolatopsis xylanica]|uniref:Uncharacterized protein n=1 Tax=Amycolatopsis xylanica TaxID=589385 RepID=A0A1H3QAK6_9PSEU|nr:hypothetical protein SAMN05421504_109178 [Amycolatopsis xylanica]
MKGAFIAYSGMKGAFIQARVYEGSPHTGRVV